MPILIHNKKANFDYHILETFQAGLSLSGQMTKLIRNRKVNLNGKFVVFQKKQLQIIGFGNEKVTENVSLLLSKKELNKIRGQLSIKGLSCIVLNLKTVGRWLKADVAIVKGKKKFDKREDLKKKDLQRDLQREKF